MKDTLALLKDKRLRLTKARLFILGQLAETSSPVTADQIWREIGNHKIDRVTVYRELATLLSHEIIREVRSGGRARCYELDSEGHAHHLVCLSCGLVDRIEMPNDLNEQEKRISRTKKFTVVRHALEFFGYCVDCRTAKLSG
jgi:Fe2+ or Zn2+ uptake regulation protein